jgi:hypothetical protein
LNSIFRAAGASRALMGQCQPRHTHTEWLKFLRQIDRETPREKRCI